MDAGYGDVLALSLFFGDTKLALTMIERVIPDGNENLLERYYIKYVNW